ncbi:hypothetical protein [Nocardia stercoris]|nr:hypothetical protein [Nocardia stercoris]
MLDTHSKPLRYAAATAMLGTAIAAAAVTATADSGSGSIALGPAAPTTTTGAFPYVDGGSSTSGQGWSYIAAAANFVSCMAQAPQLINNFNWSTGNCGGGVTVPFPSGSVFGPSGTATPTWLTTTAAAPTTTTAAAPTTTVPVTTIPATSTTPHS